MLEEVRSTICRISFKATSSINPHTKCGGICWKIGLCRHAETVRQCCQFQFWCAKDGCVIDSARYRRVVALESLVRHGRGTAMPDRSYCCYSLPSISCPSQNTTHYHPAKPCTIFSGSISQASPRLILSQMENHLKDISKDDWKLTVSTQAQLRSNIMSLSRQRLVGIRHFLSLHRLVLHQFVVNFFTSTLHGKKSNLFIQKRDSHLSCFCLPARFTCADERKTKSKKQIVISPPAGIHHSLWWHRLVLHRFCKKMNKQAAHRVMALPNVIRPWSIFYSKDLTP